MAYNIVGQNVNNLLLAEPQEPYCRLCLTTLGNSEYKSIFSPFNIMQSILEIVQLFANIEVLLEDQYSKLICMECWERLGFTQNFKNLIVNSDFKLRNFLTTKAELTNTGSLDDKLLFRETSEVKVKVEESPEVDGDQSDHEKVDIDDVGLIEQVNIKVEPDTELEMNQCNEEVKEEKINDSEPNVFSTNIDSKQNRKEYKCPLCDKVFQTSRGQKTHSYSHTGLCPIRCSVCDKGFGDKSSCEIHEAVHKETIMYQCEICGKGFKFLTNFVDHRTVHSEEIFNCDQCDKTFKTKTNLRQHKLCHRKQSYNCDQCDKVLTNKKSLKEHRSTHKNELLFICEVCNRGFRTQRNRRRHFTKVHKPERKTACPQCGKLVHNLPRHTRFHTEPFYCKRCDLSFESKELLLDHKRNHGKLFSCDLCTKAYSFKSSLVKHKLLHSDEK